MKYVSGALFFLAMALFAYAGYRYFDNPMFSALDKFYLPSIALFVASAAAQLIWGERSTASQ